MKKKPQNPEAPVKSNHNPEFDCALCGLEADDNPNLNKNRNQGWIYLHLYWLTPPDCNKYLCSNCLNVIINQLKSRVSLESALQEATRWQVGLLKT